MSDDMLFAVLNMQYEMAMSSELSRRQFYGRAQQAVQELMKARGLEIPQLPPAPSIADVIFSLTPSSLRPPASINDALQIADEARTAGYLGRWPRAAVVLADEVVRLRHALAKYEDDRK